MMFQVKAEKVLTPNNRRGGREAWSVWAPRALKMCALGASGASVRPLTSPLGVGVARLWAMFSHGGQCR